MQEQGNITMVTSNEHIWIVEVQNNNNIQVHFGIMLLSSQNFFSLTRIL
jgi:phosphotransferase system IIA component